MFGGTTKGMGSKICDPGEHLKYLGMFFSPTETPSLARLAVLRLLSTWLALRLLGWKQDDHLRCCGVVFTCMYLQNQPELSGKSPINGVFTRGNWSKNRGFSNQTCLIAGQSPNTVNQNQVKTEQFWFLCQRLPHKLQWQNQSHVSQTYNQIAWGWENLGLFCMGHSSWNWWKNRFQQSQSTRYFWDHFWGSASIFLWIQA